MSRSPSRQGPTDPAARSNKTNSRRSTEIGAPHDQDCSSGKNRRPSTTESATPHQSSLISLSGHTPLRRRQVRHSTPGRSSSPATLQGPSASQPKGKRPKPGYTVAKPDADLGQDASHHSVRSFDHARSSPTRGPHCPNRPTPKHRQLRQTNAEPQRNAEFRNPTPRLNNPTLQSNSSSRRPLRAAHTPISCRLPTPNFRWMA